jgi:hypothetical protein
VCVFDEGNCIEGSGQKSGEGDFVLGKGEWGGEGSREREKKSLGNKYFSRYIRDCSIRVVVEGK